jgi:hypothetical protein
VPPGDTNPVPKASAADAPKPVVKPVTPTAAKPQSKIGGPVKGVTLRAVGVGIDIYIAYTMARDMTIEAQFAGYAGPAKLKDELGEYSLTRANTFFTFYDKTYTSGALKGKTIELGFTSSRAETEKLEKKYGHFDWKGEFIEGQIPPVYVPRYGT